MLREYGDQIEADFTHHYGLDLGDLYRGQITPRRAGVLVQNLPAGSQTWQAAGYHHGWSTEAHLLAAVVDGIRQGNWQRTENGSKGRQHPEPIERPGDRLEAGAPVDRKEQALLQAEQFLARQAAMADHTPPDR